MRGRPTTSLVFLCSCTVLMPPCQTPQSSRCPVHRSVKCVRIPSGAGRIAEWVAQFLTLSNSSQASTIGMLIVYNIIHFQYSDRTAVTPKFGHTMYANIYMGEWLVQRRALRCSRLGSGPLCSWLVSGLEPWAP
jgi:hypothetical protein